jgi:hypothetical protein
VECIDLKKAGHRSKTLNRSIAGQVEGELTDNIFAEGSSYP